MMINNKTVLARKKLFNETGDIEVHLRKMIGGNTTNLNDFNNMKYTWVSDWYRQALLDTGRNQYEHRCAGLSQAQSCGKNCLR